MSLVQTTKDLGDLGERTCEIPTQRGKGAVGSVHRWPWRFLRQRLLGAVGLARSPLTPPPQEPRRQRGGEMSAIGTKRIEPV